MNVLKRAAKSLKSGIVRLGVLTLCFLVGAGPALAAVPQNIVYQGSMRRSGAPYSGPATFVFRITDAAGGPTYWTSGAQVLTVTGSFFRYALGTPNAAAFQTIDWANITPYIEVTVDGTVMLPREQLNATPYSIYAGSIPYVSPGASGVQVSNNLYVTGGSLGVGTSAPAAPLDVNGAAKTGYLTIASGQSVLLGRAPLVASEATTKAYVDAIAGVGGGGVLASTNSWSAWQTFLNQISFSSDVYLSAGRINVLGNKVTTAAGKLDATQLANTVPAASMVGSYPSVTGVGTLTAGTWNSTLISPTYGGTGANLSAGAAGGVPYFTAGGVMAAAPAGTSGQVLQSNGAGAPGWVSPNQSSLLSSTNTWSAWQSFNNQISVSSDVYLSAGRINVQGNKVTTAAGKLDATQLANTVPLASLSGITNAQLASGSFSNITGITNAQIAAGAFSNITGVGTLGTGVWNASLITPTYGGTGANLSGGVLGGMPYFTAGGVMAAIGAGSVGQILQSNGAAPPSWVTGQTLANNLVGGAVGDMPYQTALNTTAMLPAGPLGGMLTSNGAAAPSWLAAGPLGGLLTSNGAASPSWVPAGTANQILVSNGAAPPSWSTGFPTDLMISGGYGSVAGAAGVLTIGAGGTSPNAVSMKFGDNTGWKYHIGTNVGGTFTPRLTVRDDGNVGVGKTSPSELLETGGTDTGIYLNGSSSNFIRYNSQGVAAPSFTTRSVGAKLVLYPQINATNVDYGLGIEGSTLWYSVPQANSTFAHKFYGGTTELMRVRGDGRVGIGTASPNSALDVNGNISLVGNTTLIGAANLDNWANIRVIRSLSTLADGFYLNYGSTGGGIHFYGSGTSSQMELDGSGNLGIGTNPNAKLEVNGSILVQNTNTLQARNSGGTAESWMWPRWSDNVMYTNYGSSGWNIRNNSSSPVMFMTNGGNVGIGTTNPTAALHLGFGGIKFPDGSYMTTASIGTANGISTNGSAIINSDSDNSGGGDIIFQTGPTERGRITSGGASQIEGGFTVDNADANNGSIAPGLTFGAWGSGEGISSKRTSGGNRYGLDFYTGFSNRMSVTSGGRVGIGTSSPGWTFDVNGDTNINNDLELNGKHALRGSDAWLRLNQDGSFTSGTYTPGFLRVDGGIASGSVSSDGGGTIHSSGEIHGDGSLNMGGAIRCISGTCPSNNAIRLTPNLHLNAGNASSAVIVNWDSGAGGTNQMFRVGNGSGGDVFYVRADGTANVGSLLTVGGGVLADAGLPNGNRGFSFNGDGSYDTGLFSNGDGDVRLYSNNIEALHIDAGSNPRTVGINGNLYVNQNNNDGITFHIGSGSGEGLGSKRSAGTNQYDLEFYTASNQRMLINSAGQVIIGAGTMPSPIQLFNVNGNASNTSGVWAAYSDRRLKRDITTMTGALDIVDKLRPVTFHWKDAKKDAEYGRVRGLIAQEVEEVVPEWVKTDSQGMKMISPVGMDATLIEAIKELKARVDAQHARIKELEAKLKP